MSLLGGERVRWVLNGLNKYNIDGKLQSQEQED